MTKIEVRDAILDEVYEIAVEKSITTLKELKKFLPKHIARSAPLSSVVDEKDLVDILGEAHETLRNREKEAKNSLTAEEKKIYTKLYKKCNGKPPNSLR